MRTVSTGLVYTQMSKWLSLLQAILGVPKSEREAFIYRAAALEAQKVAVQPPSQ
jgi:hypothetical protein